MGVSYFQILNRSSKMFLEMAETEQNSIKRKCLILSAVINSWVLLEAYGNYVSEIMAKGKMCKHERAMLLDKELKLDNDGRFSETNSHSPILKRMLFLLDNFSAVDIKVLKTTTLWNKIKICEDLRNSLIHPRNQASGDSITIAKAREYRHDIVQFIRYVNQKVFRRQIFLD